MVAIVGEYALRDRIADSFIHVAKNPDVLGRTVKLDLAIAEFAKSIFKFYPEYDFNGYDKAIEQLAACLLTAKNVLNATSIFDRIDEWMDDKKRQAIIAQGWPKTTSRVCLTVAHFFDTVNFVDKAVIHHFNSPVRRIYDMTVLSIVRNSFYMIGAVFGFVRSVREIRKTKKKLNNVNCMDKGRKELESKITKEKITIAAEVFKFVGIGFYMYTKVYLASYSQMEKLTYLLALSTIGVVGYSFSFAKSLYGRVCQRVKNPATA